MNGLDGLYGLTPQTLNPKQVNLNTLGGPPPVIVTIGDNRDDIKVLLYSNYTIITGRRVLLINTLFHSPVSHLRDPSIHIIPTLGPKVCTYNLHWAIWIPGVNNPKP